MGTIRIVNKGEWIEDEYGIPHCSVCRAINTTVYRNYCPNCGADMQSTMGQVNRRDAVNKEVKP